MKHNYNILSREYFCFDDVLLVPQYSEVSSRTNINIETEIAGIKLWVPIISANMDSITEEHMAEAMAKAGGLGILHRYSPKNKIIERIRYLNQKNLPAVLSVGVHSEFGEFIKSLINDCELEIDAVCIDVAHGHSKQVEYMAKLLKQLKCITIAGNIATLEAATMLADIGVDTIKVGIGPGSLCTTRIVTGCGVPQLSAIMECSEIKDKYPSVRIIADGGIRNSGDIVKALAAGADAVMIGRLFAGCLETPGEVIQGKKIYRGMASFSAQMEHDGKVHGVPEGEAIFVPALNVSVKEIVKSLADGIRSGFSYCGSNSIKELQEKAIFIRVTGNTVLENKAKFEGRF